MDYLDLALERMNSWERTLEENKHATEARRLGLTASGWSPLAHFDTFLIRASKRSNERQARREQASKHRELAS